MSDFDPIVEIDCTTGITEIRDPIPEEVEQFHADAKHRAADDKTNAKAAAATEAKRTAVLEKVAQTAGCTLDELRDALGTP
jgi:hypothetical protein